MGETCGEFPPTGISWTLSHQFSSLFIYRWKNPRISRKLQCFPRTFFFIKRSEISARSWIAEALDSWMCLEVEWWVAVVGYGKVYSWMVKQVTSPGLQFILQQILAIWLMKNSAYPQKSKQNNLSKYLFDWKENTTIEKEEGKVILDLLSDIYDFEEKKKAFLSCFFHAFIIS